MHHLQLLCIAVVLYEWALCNERGQHVIRAQRNKLQQKRCAYPLIAHSMFSPMQVSNLGFSSQDTLFYIAASEAVGLFKV